MNRPFNALSDADKQLLQREVKKLAAALRTRIALRQKRARTGHLDAKATIRASLKYNGVPMEIKHKITEFAGSGVASEITLDPDIFATQVRKQIIAEIVRWQLAKRRSGNSSTLT